MSGFFVTKKLLKSFLIGIGIISMIFFLSIIIPIIDVLSMPSVVTMYQSDCSLYKPSELYYVFHKELNNKCIQTSSSACYEPEIVIKLFNLIPIKKQKIQLLQDEEVLVSGNVVGMTVKTKGVVVISPINNPLFKKGDCITKIGTYEIISKSDIANIIDNNYLQGGKITVEYIRDGEVCQCESDLVYDDVTNKYKLGLWVKDSIASIGTLTYIKADKRFGALGHGMNDSDVPQIIDASSGNLYDCNIIGINKAHSGSPGEVKGIYLENKNAKGVIDKNSKYGVYGYIDIDADLINKAKIYPVGSRQIATPGKATILCSLDGGPAQEYNIEIIKTNYQNYSNDKSMVIRVTDNKLLHQTGGIVQGMSGSPILQNGRLIGALTHVFVNDPTKGFGIYIDWMINE